MSQTGKYMKLFGIVLLSLGALNTVANAEDTNSQCHNEMVLLTIWQSQNLISYADYSSSTATLRVDSRSWLQTPAAAHQQIGLAAYCIVHSRYPEGKVIIVGSSDEDFGLAEAGIWHDRLFGK
jgi:hypothetical protein